jgi:hypothetical protein
MIRSHRRDAGPAELICVVAVYAIALAGTELWRCVILDRHRGARGRPAVASVPGRFFLGHLGVGARQTPQAPAAEAAVPTPQPSSRRLPASRAFAPSSETGS